MLDQLLQIGFLYNHFFGERVINNLINKQRFCTQCGPLCINCRDHYSWFAGMIQYVHHLQWNPVELIQESIQKIEEKLIPLDLLICIAIPKELLSSLPEIIQKYNVKAVIFPIEDPKWMDFNDEIQLQQTLKKANIQYAFPRPFCSLSIQANPMKSIINEFIHQFRIGKPSINLVLKHNKIIDNQIIFSAPCGATYYIAQYLRNEAFNTWNLDSLEKRISTALEQYPCIASRQRDPTSQNILRIIAEENTQETFKVAFNNATPT